MTKDELIDMLLEGRSVENAVAAYYGDQIRAEERKRCAEIVRGLKQPDVRGGRCGGKTYTRSINLALDAAVSAIEEQADA